MSFYDNISKAFKTEMLQRLEVVLLKIKERTEVFESQLKANLETSLKNISEKFNISIEDLNKEIETLFDTSITLENLSSDFEVDDALFDIKSDISKAGKSRRSTKNLKGIASRPLRGLELRERESGEGIEDTKEEEMKTCKYTFTKGKNKGQDCKIRVKGGGDYCSKHKKGEKKNSEDESVEEPVEVSNKGGKDSDDEDSYVEWNINGVPLSDILEMRKRENEKTKKTKKTKNGKISKDKENSEDESVEEPESVEELVEVSNKGGKETKKTKNGKKSSKDDEDEKTCKYTFAKGINKGQGCKIRVKGEGDYCSKHKKEEKKDSEDECADEIKECLPKFKRKPKFTHNKDLNIYVHLPTNLVIKSVDDHTVVGRLSKNRVMQLEDVDIEVCNENNMLYDQEYDITKINE